MHRSKSSDTSPVSFRCDSDLNNLFQKKYPYCLSQFLKRAMKLALNDKKFFDKVFFSEVE